MVMDTATRSTFDLAVAPDRGDVVKLLQLAHARCNQILQELSGSVLQELQSTSSLLLRELSPAATIWREHFATVAEGLQTSAEPTDPIEVDEARRRADFLAQIDTMVRQSEGGAAPAIESAARLTVQRVSDSSVLLSDEFLDDSWDPVPIQHVRAVAPVRASIRFATPRPFEAD